MTAKQRTVWQVLALVAAGLLLGWGILREEPVVVLTKAANICLECIGIG